MSEARCQELAAEESERPLWEVSTPGARQKLLTRHPKGKICVRQGKVGQGDQIEVSEVHVIAQLFCLNLKMF